MDNKFSKRSISSLAKKSVVPLVLTFSMSNVNATPITVGSLTYDAANDPNVIVDQANNREWLRWDVLSGQTYGATLSQTQAGPYAGWNIADHNDAQSFLDALLPAGKVNSCQPMTNEGCWTDNANMRSYHDLVGDSHIGGDSYDTIFFQSHIANNAGFIQLTRSGSLLSVSKTADFASIATADSVAPANIGWLMYRDLPQVAPMQYVSEPAYVSFLGLAVLALGGWRRRVVRQSR